jgi:hypothetical protein
LTNIKPDGSWTADVTTNPNDKNATEVAACLVVKTYIPPKLKGDIELPDELLSNCKAFASKAL